MGSLLVLCAQANDDKINIYGDSPFVFVHHYGEFERLIYNKKTGYFITEDNMMFVVRDLQDYFYFRRKFMHLEAALDMSIDMERIDEQVIGVMQKREKYNLRKGLGIGLGIGAGVTGLFVLILNLAVVRKD